MGLSLLFAPTCLVVLRKHYDKIKLIITGVYVENFSVNFNECHHYKNNSLTAGCHRLVSWEGRSEMMTQQTAIGPDRPKDCSTVTTLGF